MFSTLCLSAAAAGATAAAFGHFPEWASAMLAGRPDMPGSAQAPARYTLTGRAPVCNLDDVSQLRELKLQPSDVVTRDYAVSRAGALRVFQLRKWFGVRWWSWYDPRWSSFDL
ncbi:MAG TPA: hypothetical protein VHZ74_12435 [Bryobacteraceae bacterium]|nr:hypothetical protein [Bryobacteraceae bacterium]